MHSFIFNSTGGHRSFSRSGFNQEFTEHPDDFGYYHADRVGQQKRDPVGGFHQPGPRRRLQRQGSAAGSRARTAAADFDDHPDDDLRDVADSNRFHTRFRIKERYGLGINRRIDLFHVNDVAGGAGGLYASGATKGTL